MRFAPFQSTSPVCQRDRLPRVDWTGGVPTPRLPLLPQALHWSWKLTSPQTSLPNGLLQSQSQLTPGATQTRCSWPGMLRRHWRLKSPGENPPALYPGRLQLGILASGLFWRYWLDRDHCWHEHEDIGSTVIDVGTSTRTHARSDHCRHEYENHPTHQPQKSLFLPVFGSTTMELHGAVMSQLFGLDTHCWHGG